MVILIHTFMLFSGDDLMKIIKHKNNLNYTKDNFHLTYTTQKG